MFQLLLILFLRVSIGNVAQNERLYQIVKAPQKITLRPLYWQAYPNSLTNSFWILAQSGTMASQPGTKARRDSGNFIEFHHKYLDSLTDDAGNCNGVLNSVGAGE